HRLGASFIALGEEDYPFLLRQSDGPPPLICVRGRRELLNARSAAIVGSRNASAVGRKLTRTLAHDLGRAGYVTVSGLARGIDTAAHEASLEAGTIAVMAGGIDIIYPPENAALYQRICETGLVVTEMTPGVRPQARHFPRRNRIISGLSLGTVVVEAALRSGSLITARLAGEQNREVFAVPGSPLDPRAGGANRLLRDGAHLVTCADDITCVLDGLDRQAMPGQGFFAGDSGDDDGFDFDEQPAMSARQQLISLLGPAPVHTDDLIRESGLSAGEVNTIIMELELAGRIERQSGQRISLI
ncbi:MAG TPA: DNA-protecting protein DprA, partial [Rhizobiales bacterium]|nr:DNA-protecting protein DprA [Hyphomicrobiales bacterium]